jgi:hypothetical protein
MVFARKLGRRKVGEKFLFILWGEWEYESEAVGKILAINESETGPVALVHLPPGFNPEMAEEKDDPIYPVHVQSDGSLIMGCDTDFLYPPPASA